MENFFQALRYISDPFGQVGRGFVPLKGCLVLSCPALVLLYPSSSKPLLVKTSGGIDRLIHLPDQENDAEEDIVFAKRLRYADWVYDCGRLVNFITGAFAVPAYLLIFWPSNPDPEAQLGISKLCYRRCLGKIKDT